MINNKTQKKYKTYLNNPETHIKILLVWVRSGQKKITPFSLRQLGPILACKNSTKKLE